MTFKYKRQNNDLEKLVKAQEAENSNFAPDARFWRPVLDKSGNGYAVIRFLPAPPQDGEEGLPWAQYFHHSFQGPSGQWYIENSLTTPTKASPKGEKDPCSEYNNKLWNSTQDENSPARKQASAQKRKLTYVSNILVIKDPANPDNEGKVFLYKYGVKIYDKIKAKMHPAVAGKPGVNVFDPFDGCDFELNIKTISFGNQKFPNYDESIFLTPSPVAKNEAEFEKIWNTQHSLALENVIPDGKFKTYDELKKRLDLVLDVDGTTTKKAARSVTEDTEEEEIPPFEVDSNTADDDDDDLKRFESLAKNL